MRELNEAGTVWLGGGLKLPKTLDVSDDREAWRVGISAAISKKLKPEYLGCRLLIYAHLCSFNLVDGEDFRDVITEAGARVGRAKWGAIFDRLYVLDLWPGKFIELRA